MKPVLHCACRREAVMQTLGASVRQACAVSTHGMASDPQFSHSHLAGAAALAQLQRSLRERYSLEVQVSRVPAYSLSRRMGSDSGFCVEGGCLVRVCDKPLRKPNLVSPVLHLLPRGS